MGILKKLLDHAVDVVNPNTPSDKLKRAAAGQSSEYIKGQPAKIPSRNDEPGFQFRNNSLTRGASRVFDQLNMADNNRTWSQRTPTNDRSYWGQGYDIGKKVVKPFYETGDFAMQSAQVGLHNAFGDPNSEEAQIDRAKRDASYNESIVPSASRAVWQLRESNPVDRAWGTTPTYMKERDTNNKAEDYIKQGYSPEAVQAWKTQELDNWYQESLRKAGFNMNDTSAQVYAKSFGDIGSTAGYVVSPAAGAMVNGPKAIIGESVRQGVFNAIPNMASAYGQGGSGNDIVTAGAAGFGMGTLLTGAGYVAPRIIPGARNSGDAITNTPVNRIDQPNIMQDPRVAAFDDNIALLNEARQKALAEGMSPNTALVKNNDKAFKATTIAKQEAAKKIRDDNQAGFIGKDNNEPTIRNVFGEEVPNPAYKAPLYHGTSKTNAKSIEKTGYKLSAVPREFKGYFDKYFDGQNGYVSFSTSRDGAKRYAGRGSVLENSLSPNAKIVSFDDIPSVYKDRIIEINKLYNSGITNEEWINRGYSRPRFNAEVNGILEKYAQENNIDGISFGKSLSQRIVEPDEVRIYNPKALESAQGKTGIKPNQRGSVNPGEMIDDAKNAASKIKKLLKERKEAMLAGSSEYAYATEQKLKALGYDVNAKVEAPQATTSAQKKPVLKDTSPETKKSSFAQGVASSKEISDPLKTSVRKSSPEYVPIENADLVEASEAFVKKGYKKAATEIGERLNIKEGKISGQDVADAIHVIKKLDEKGGTANIQLATDLSEKLSMHLTKAGQTIQAASLLSNRTPEGMLYGARKFLTKNGIEVTDEINKTLKSKIDEIRNAKTHEDKLYRIAELQAMVEKQVPSSNLDKGIGLWKAGLLTGIKTQTGNTLSGISTNLMKLPADAIASPLDMAFEKLGKTQFGKKLGFEGKRSKAFTVRGTKEGAVEGVQKGWKSLKTGIDERNMETSKFDTKRLVFSNSPAGKAAQKYTDTVYGLMGAADRPNYYINLRRNLNDLGLVEAMNRRLKGPERAKFLEEYIANPPTKAFQEATNAAEKAVFANDTQLSKWAGALRQASEDKPIAKAAINIAMPFTKVPSAVAMRMVDYSPVGAVKTLIEQISKVKKTGAIDQRALVEGLSEAGIGTGAMVLGYKLKEAGLMTGSYPKDPKEQELWKLEGKQPNSIKIGNGWKSINYTSPAGQVIANGSKIYDAYAEGKRGLDLVSSSAAAGAKTLTEQSFLQGVQGALDVISDPERSAYKYIKNTAGSVIPTISSDIAKATTGTQKRVDDIKDSIVSRIPIANRTLSDKIDAFGEPLKRQSNSVNTMVDPFRTSDVKDPNPLNTELRRLQDAGFGVMPTPVDKKISFGSKEKGNLEEFVLTPDQQDAMNKKIGKITKERWNQIIATDSYKQMNDREKQKALSDLLTDARALGKADYASKNKPELLDKVDLTKKQISLGTSSGVDNYLISPKDRKDADVAKQVEEFKNSDSNSKIIGKNYYYKDKDGEVRKKSSAQYEYDKVDSKANLEMDRAKDSGNLDAWSESANKKLEAMKTLYRTLDKNTEQDKIDDLTLKIENLYSDINKYTSYGGFKKGGSGSKSGSKSDYFSKIANLEKKSSNAALRSILTKRQYQTKAKIYKARTA